MKKIISIYPDTCFAVYGKKYKNSIKKAVFLFLTVLFLLPVASFTQVVNISGVINDYTPVTNFYPCSNKIAVGNSAAYSVGDTVLIIQMQGAIIDEVVSGATYGDVTNYNSCGKYEKAIIADISGLDITFEKDLINVYDVAGSVQMISIPQYNDVNVNGLLTCTPWNGNIGGILVFEAVGTVTLNANIDVSLNGFRGGLKLEILPNGCNAFQNNNNNYYDNANYRAANKSEGIAKISVGREFGRGPQGNGAGGANDHNSGGGGGGNSVAGGIGGRNAEPGNFNCKGPNPGYGGKALNYVPGQLFLGGGGGAGHGNNNGSTSGTNGGGIVMIAANSFNGNGFMVKSNSANAGGGDFDGVGGGGAGGTIMLAVNSFMANAFTIQATGGNGGNAGNGFSNRCYGPGGGGAGGVILLGGTPLPGTVTTTLTPGNPGITINSTNGCNNTSNNATAGTPGQILSGWSIPMGSVIPGPGCLLPMELGEFTITQRSETAFLEWTTLTELNSSHFEIQRSNDGQVFKPIERINAQGNSTSEVFYNFTDMNPGTGIVYYRFKMIDLDGKYRYSEIRSIFMDQKNIPLIAVYPNPVSQNGSLNIDLNISENGNTVVQVYDLKGSLVFNDSKNFSSGQQKYILEVSTIPSGTYLLKVVSAGVMSTKKIVISR